MALNAIKVADLSFDASGSDADEALAQLHESTTPKPRFRSRSRGQAFNDLMAQADAIRAALEARTDEGSLEDV
jgi:hypothetical protein